ncbi:hypothetical protein GJ744_003675 [Endocarpon pusillum]|uniref:Uncharacterized protein n=1 Tax=Endocarpon pusillum TaxID=364733 RepID=A0A8H7A9P1_9EURO|nr:hypothetical protein GJ744_003675 [Endocarpon pusillum]
MYSIPWFVNEYPIKRGEEDCGLSVGSLRVDSETAGAGEASENADSGSFCISTSSSSSSAVRGQERAEIVELSIKGSI